MKFDCFDDKYTFTLLLCLNSACIERKGIERKERQHNQIQMSKTKTTPVSVPVGYRFHPTDEELVDYYLKQKMLGNDSEINGTIPEIDVCNYEPTELPALLGTETEDRDVEWFFFTRKHYKYHNSDRPNRCTKKGYWKSTCKEREIKDRRSKAVIGKKKTLTFYQGRVPNSKKTGWVIHEYSPTGKGDFVICRLKYKPDKKDSSICDEGQPSSSHVMFNCENQAADVMIQEENGESLLYPPPPLDDCCSSALQSPTSLELGDVLQANGTNDDCNELQSPFGDNDSWVCNKNGVSTRDEDETVYDVFTELCDPPEKNLDSLFRPIQPQDYSSSTLQSPIYTERGNVPHPLQPQDYQPTILQSPIYTNLENVPQANVYYGECNKWQSAFKKTISTNEVDIPVRHIMSNFENQATDYSILELIQVYPQTEGNLESLFYPFQPQDSTLQPLMYTNFGDALHNIECNELQSRFWGQ